MSRLLALGRDVILPRRKDLGTDDVPGIKTFAEIIDDLKLKFNLKTGREALRLLGFPGPYNISVNTRTTPVPVFRILALCAREDISADELFFGRLPEDHLIRQFEREDIAKRVIGVLIRLEKENPEYYRSIYRNVIGEVDWISTEKRAAMSKRLVFDKSVLLQRNRDKIIEAVLYFVANSENCEIFKLSKLMYFMDFVHFRETGRSVTGLVYFAWKEGPVPVNLYTELISNPKPDLIEAIEVKTMGPTITFIPHRDSDQSFFSRREKRLMRELSDYFREAESGEMTEKYHLSKEPWFRTFTSKGERSLIRYIDAVDGKRGLTRREIIERQEEMRDMYKNFGISWDTMPAYSGDLYKPED